VRRRFFVERFAGGTARLAGEAAHHLGRVLHAEPGQLYELSDGNSVFLARIERISSSDIDFSLLEPLSGPAASPEIVLLLAIVKFDRFEWALEKATELGVHAVVPLAAERTAKALSQASTKRADRWRKILRESAQQARCLRPPVLEATERPAAAFAQSAGAINVLFSERPSARPARAVFRQLASKESASRRINLAFGPEGGWTDQEFDAASAAGFAEASLGRNILRSETAVVAGLAAVHLYFDPDDFDLDAGPEGQAPAPPVG
jgi:16S rRNA (uracil1498-N3)-methyltransferase